MAGFRRLVIGITEFFLVISIFVFTFLAGAAGALSGQIYFTALNATSMSFGNWGPVAVGTVVGAVLGALIGFTTTCSAAAMLFAVSQIELNTRNFVAEEKARRNEPGF
jgi:uncharacterized protein (DUF2062 family)